MTRGRRSRYEAKDWTCPKCQIVYQPVKCLLIDVPQLECPVCQTQNEADFNFNILKLHKNGIKCRPPVYNQGSTGFCALYACKAQAEIKSRIEGASCRWFGGDPLDEEHMLEIYESELGVNFGQEGKGDQGEVRVERMMQTLRKGVKFKNRKTKKVMKIKDVWRAKKDFVEICRLLANAEPLVSSFPIGQDFDNLGHNKIYKSPTLERMKEKEKTAIAHAVCLVGAGVRVERGIYKRYLWFRNSYGKFFGLSGDGMVAFSNLILDPFGISF